MSAGRRVKPAGVAGADQATFGLDGSPRTSCTQAKIAVEGKLALVQPVPAAGIEDQSLGLARPGMEIARAGGGQDLVGLAVNEQHRSRRQFVDPGCAARLAAERRDRERRGDQPCVDHHGAAERMTDEHQPVLSLPDQPFGADRDVADAFDKITGLAVGELELGDAAPAKLPAEPRVEPACWPAQAAARTEYPDHRRIAVGGVQPALDGPTIGDEPEPLGIGRLGMPIDFEQLEGESGHR